MAEINQRLSYDGPPYANGDIHMGHALNKVSRTSLYVQYWTVSGNVPAGIYDLPIGIDVSYDRKKMSRLHSGSYNKYAEQVDRQRENSNV